jgi:hypothetical protein
MAGGGAGAGTVAGAQVLKLVLLLYVSYTTYYI